SMRARGTPASGSSAPAITSRARRASSLEGNRICPPPMRRIVIGVIALAIAAPSARAATADGHALKRYVAQVEVHVGAYRKLLRRSEMLFAEEEHVNVDPVVERFYALADQFEDLDVRWQAATAPSGLKVRHRSMGRV